MEAGQRGTGRRWSTVQSTQLFLGGRSVAWGRSPWGLMSSRVGVTHLGGRVGGGLTVDGGTWTPLCLMILHSKGEEEFYAADLFFLFMVRHAVDRRTLLFFPQYPYSVVLGSHGETKMTELQSRILKIQNRILKIAPSLTFIIRVLTRIQAFF